MAKSTFLGTDDKIQFLQGENLLSIKHFGHRLLTYTKLKVYSWTTFNFYVNFEEVMGFPWKWKILIKSTTFRKWCDTAKPEHRQVSYTRPKWKTRQSLFAFKFVIQIFLKLMMQNWQKLYFFLLQKFVFKKKYRYMCLSNFFSS